jgi:hypothetical protein
MDTRFEGLANEELADIWYALSGAEIRHTDVFKPLVDASLQELDRRLGNKLREFLDLRFAALRAVDVPEDALATAKAQVSSQRVT